MTQLQKENIHKLEISPDPNLNPNSTRASGRYTEIDVTVQG